MLPLLRPCIGHGGSCEDAGWGADSRLPPQAPCAARDAAGEVHVCGIPGWLLGQLGGSVAPGHEALPGRGRVVVQRPCDVRSFVHIAPQRVQPPLLEPPVQGCLSAVPHPHPSCRPVHSARCAYVVLAVAPAERADVPRPHLDGELGRRDPALRARWGLGANLARCDPLHPARAVQLSLHQRDLHGARYASPDREKACLDLAWV
mmetsp:Transcript_1568/g.3997  ORF Transcript_1568/g.3997 Transcript_1568/m.3997 type:complete len:204 (+) Transcript_1568:1115-1726(+)